LARPIFAGEAAEQNETEQQIRIGYIVRRPDIYRSADLLVPRRQSARGCNNEVGPKRSSTSSARKHGRWLNAASKRAEWGGVVGGVAQSWDNHTPLQVMLRSRGPGSQPGHRGRGHRAIGERLDLRPHRLRRQLPVVCISCRRRAKGPQNFDGATQPASLCLRKKLGHYIHTTRARTYTARESVHGSPRANCWREARPSCCRRLSCRAVRSCSRGPRRHLLEP